MARNDRPSTGTALGKTLAWLVVLSPAVLLPVKDSHAGDGFVRRGKERLFAIGFYELPKDNGQLTEMAAAGVNLVHCHGREDLDRLQAVGMMGVMPLALQQGATEALREKINSVKDHAALAVWEGPDEIVWSFTALSTLYRTQGVYKHPDEWVRQTPLAIRYSESRAAEIMPKLRDAIRLVRQLDGRNRQVWINEAHESDVRFVRQYLDEIDITGCDLYPVKHKEQPIFKIGPATDRWRLVGRGKPVWMVLQAFSWSELGDYYGHKVLRYPTFMESRFMAYEAVVHGARGILYWGSREATDKPFRASLYALTSELAALQPLLVQADHPHAEVTLVESREHSVERGVRMAVRRRGHDWLIILVNEDDHRHMAVEVTGLDDLNDRHVVLLCGDETIRINQGELITRMQPFEVKVFATSKDWETSRQEGRDYP